MYVQMAGVPGRFLFRNVGRSIKCMDITVRLMLIFSFHMIDNHLFVGC